METKRLPVELLALVVANALGDHFSNFFQDRQRPSWDAILTLTRTSPLLHDLTHTALHRSLGTRYPSTRRTFRPSAPFLGSALPTDVRRKLRFVRRLCSKTTGEGELHANEIKTTLRFCAEHRDANSPLAKAYITFVAAQAMVARRAHNRAFDALEKCLRYCAQVRPAELVHVLYHSARKADNDLRLALQLSHLSQDLFNGFLLPRDQAITSLSRCLDVLECHDQLQSWQLDVGGLPRLLTMMRDNEEYAPNRTLRRRAGALLLRWQAAIANN
ncbi:hypothetical protein BKA62DRAFT_685515 [Auriculariales sp. MPI-PUGE-AT-0066]|nr:hypothetical protein BKA62DRAFT_685515 [Auriculariales sp. MPI-PUGE-AT-0066]